MTPDLIYSMFDPFRLCLAFGPLAIYFLLIGSVNLSRRPILAPGGRDFFTLALGLFGVFLVGPIEYLLPERVLSYYGAIAWLMATALYFLWTIVAVLTMRPRLIIYNISADKLRPILAEAVEKIDEEARWAGDCLALPTLKIQLVVESFRLSKNVSLKAVGRSQNFQGWRKLERALTAELEKESASPGFRGLFLFFLGVAICGGLIWMVTRDPQAVTGPLVDGAKEVFEAFTKK